ncbi:hypothetical protein Ssi03_61720 [Sphaerisporangium siamense]|uniref:Phosphoribosylformylglycinamidine synthase n=1 Tax=Sphaerisporangium siamense TaxID=795645 RepID=A0A7W7DAN9_9ACTN|nr:hypothetical protein [Sphaerisporangium siamense]MBB4702485.1 hypothetical protein [Sphaerisporangium siamense]GII88182.1 hypothetical protein Ssi03_61720 [Sphaerisporangium siamense]
MLVELTLRRVAGEPSPNSPVDGIRILALLPRRWHKDLRHVTDEIAIRVQTDDHVTAAQIRDQVAEILTNPEVSDWAVLACEPVTV